MTLSPTARIGIAASFLYAAASATQAYAYAPHAAPSLSEIRGWEINQATALQKACRNPGGGYSDDQNIYFKIDESLSALAIPIAYFMANYDPVEKKIDLPENPPRVLCPV